MSLKPEEKALLYLSPTNARAHCRVISEKPKCTSCYVSDVTFKMFLSSNLVSTTSPQLQRRDTLALHALVDKWGLHFSGLPHSAQTGP